MSRFSPSELAEWTGGRWTATPVAPLSGFTIDSRQLRTGEVFVAIKTAQRDGHAFLAAACAAGARQWPLAEEYAKKARELQPADPSSARLLAFAYRGQGKLRDAEETLVYALRLKIDNDRLVAELEEDLAEVRKQLSTRS